MQLLPKLVTILACLLSNGSFGMTTGGGAVLSRDEPVRPSFQCFDLIQCPVQLPPKRDTAVIAQGAEGIDEEDRDKGVNASAPSLNRLVSNVFGLSLHFTRFSVDRLSIAAGPVAAVLRC